jgi:hypothetical protein
VRACFAPWCVFDTQSTAHILCPNPTHPMPHPHDHAHKVSDPIMFGRAVRALLSDVFAKHEKAIAEIGASVNDGLGAFIAKIKGSSYHPEVVKVRSTFTLWTQTLLCGYTTPSGLHNTHTGLQHRFYFRSLHHTKLTTAPVPHSRVRTHFTYPRFLNQPLDHTLLTTPTLLTTRALLTTPTRPPSPF